MGSSRTIKAGGTGIVLLLACLLVLTKPAAVIAHTTSTGLATLTVTGSTLTYRLTLILSALPEEPARLLTAAADGDAGSVERVAALLRQSLQIRTADRTWLQLRRSRQLRACASSYSCHA